MEIGRIVVPEFEALVQRERVEQDDKWGVQNHTPYKWMTILTEELGELAQTILDLTKEADGSNRLTMVTESELIHVASVCKAMWESGKRQGWL
ncbi:hypothetical protein LCGC14_2111780 [marine sediment metagenome]|uniref:NTP pyrophosphohydrolase MazG putative catalytic core domain-containing protein n=1 Tax=marine sediment metagenome TaxID=412755 RepID=A0A0F9EU25_9ZZZZ